MDAWIVTERPGEHTLGMGMGVGMGPALLDRARVTGEPCVGGRVVTGPGVILGAVQRAGAVVDMEACACAGVAIWRRATTGTAAWAGGSALWWSLALPHVAALVSDATAPTVLNRNIRGFLQGLTRCGAQAHYAGREWVAVKHRPCAVLGLDQADDGAVLIDVIAGWDEPVGLPDALVTDRERGTVRWLDRVPVALGELVGSRSPVEVLRTVIEAVASRAGRTLVWAPHALGGVAGVPVTRANDPLPLGLYPGASVRVPIGWIDTASEPVLGEGREGEGREGEGREGEGRAWIGGDVLTGRAALVSMAQGAAWGDGALVGALPADLARALAAERGHAHGRT